MADAETFLASERDPASAALLMFRRTGDAPELVGCAGFGRRPSGAIEFGYWVARPHWGKGYATEAGRALVAIARDSLRIARLSAGHFLDNHASGRVLEKIGFRPTGIVAPRFSAGRRAEAPCRLFELDLRDDPAASDAAVAEPAARMAA
jgi:RimJ/RimL family protein N-acetyltransferase